MKTEGKRGLLHGPQRGKKYIFFILYVFEVQLKMAASKVCTCLELYRPHSHLPTQCFLGPLMSRPACHHAHCTHWEDAPYAAAPLAGVQMGEPPFGLVNFIGGSKFVHIACICLLWVLILNSFDHVNEVIYEQTYKTRDLEIPGLHLVSEGAEGTKVLQNT